MHLAVYNQCLIKKEKNEPPPKEWGLRAELQHEAKQAHHHPCFGYSTCIKAAETSPGLLGLSDLTSASHCWLTLGRQSLNPQISPVAAQLVELACWASSIKGLRKGKEASTLNCIILYLISSSQQPLRGMCALSLQMNPFISEALSDKTGAAQLGRARAGV